MDKCVNMLTFTNVRSLVSVWLPNYGAKKDSHQNDKNQKKKKKIKKKTINK